MAFKLFAEAAKKALSLKKDGVFKLLVVMTALLGFVSGSLAASGMVAQNIYTSWHLQKKSELSVYVPAGVEEETLNQLVLELAKMGGVEKVERLAEQDVRALVADYLAESDTFPLPAVVEVQVNQNLNQTMLRNKVEELASGTVVDDGREILNFVGESVRLLQSVAGALGAVMLGIMVMLVSLTVRAGLRSQRKSVHILSYVGATDGFLNALIVYQVLARSLVGWAVAALLASAALGSVSFLWPMVQNYMTWQVWAASVATPLLFTLMSALVAWVTAHHVIRQES